MGLFDLRNGNRSERSQRIYAAFELAHTIIDFLAAIAFLVGSILFFWKAYEVIAIWFFVVGSVCFAVKPSLRLARELKLASIGDSVDLAQRYDNS
ncbi:YrhK family protein [Roseisalinus antarcticus]|uniref:YrhK domain-containing protein n=1 Tax=Roseisalinus antarcticus TaxID=254357 RepID=A0A1Y5RQM9_9RHOB|nr:YrhK family protein [Roseisalinus antarcticus]SLN22174.1 hypothetical protein ROA7023_00618 [Roseisalinus antarcticus]